MLKIKKIKPMFVTVVTTMDKYEDDEFTEGGVISSNSRRGTVKEYLTVIAVGSSVRDIKEGDKVFINPSRYAVKKYKEDSLKNGIVADNSVSHYNFNIIELNDKPCLVLLDRDIEFVIEDSEEITTSKLILPEKKKVIVNV